MTVVTINDTAQYKAASGEIREALGVFNIGLTSDPNAQIFQPALTANFWNYGDVLLIGNAV